MATYEYGLIFIIAGFFGGILAIFTGFRQYRKYRLINDLPMSKIRSIAMGLAKIKGKARPVKEIHAPFSGKKCCYYAYSVKKVYTGKNSKGNPPKFLDKGRSNVPFCLDDGTGKVMIDTKALFPLSWTEFRSKKSGKQDPVIKKLMKAGIISRKDIEDPLWRVIASEGVVREGDEYFVMGTAADNPYVEEGTAQTGVEDTIIKRGEYGIMTVSKRMEWEILYRDRTMAICAISAGAVVSILFAIMMFAYFGR